MTGALRHRLTRITRALNVPALPAEVAAELWLHGLIGERDLSDAQLEATTAGSGLDWREFTDAEVEGIASGRRSPQECICRRQRARARDEHFEPPGASARMPECGGCDVADRGA